MKTVSFVVPVYNPPLDLFRGMFRSLPDQTGDGLGIVAVNDAAAKRRALAAERRIAAMRGSLFWHLTAPPRAVLDFGRPKRREGGK